MAQAQVNPSDGSGGGQVEFSENESFTERVSKCENLKLGKSSCPSDKLVGLDDVIEESLEIVMKGLCDETSDTHRVPPLAVTRLARGGKTTALVKLFDAIKNRSLNEVKVNVMIFSFNGFTNFERGEKGETQAESIIRNIVRQLVPKFSNIRYTKETLDEYIGNRPFVLIIDELNRISNAGGDRNPVDHDAKCLLQQLFLGKKNRYLVFSTHYEINIDPLAEDYVASESDPGVKSISLPVCTDLETLRNMPGCESINAATVALYGGIPSLIYSVVALDELAPDQRFANAELKAKSINNGDVTSLLSDFVGAVITGEKKQSLKKFEQFAITKDGKLQWPICFIKCILGLFKATYSILYIMEECDKLVMQASSTESGKDWECIIGIALGFRCLHQQLYGSESPFDIAPLGVKPNMFPIALPDDVQSIEAAKEYMLEIVKRSFPTFVLATPTYSNFPIDGFVAYFETKENVVICGYQAKLGKGVPKSTYGKKRVLERGILLQGRALDKHKSIDGWEHWNKEQVQQLLGFSLRDLYPTNLSSIDPLAAEAEETVPGNNNKKIKNK